jgi:hypothetical protein
MSGPLRKITSIVDRDFSAGTSEQCVLSIEIQPDGFSFAILDTVQLKHQLLEVFQSDATDSPFGVTSESLQSLIRDNKYLQNTYKKVVVACYARHLLLYPDDGFIMEDKEALYRTFCKLPPSHKVRSDQLKNMGGYGVYAIHEDFMNLLDVSFPNHKLVHAGSAFIENLLTSMNQGNDQSDLVLHVRRTYFEILLKQDKGLAFYRSFTYHSFEDLLYYLFYVLQRLNKVAQEMNILLTGEIRSDSKEFRQLASYFNHVSLSERKNMCQYASDFNSIPRHFYNNLLNPLSCE